MENLNLGMILRQGPTSSSELSSTASAVSSRGEGPRKYLIDSPSRANNVRHHHHHHHHHYNSSEDADDTATLGRSDTTASASVRAPETLLGPHFDPHDDSASLRRYWDAIFYPEVYMPVFYALRITLMVALPLAILARHPNVMQKFPAHVVLPLWGVVDCKYTFGEQLSQSIVSYQVGIWMGLWGGLANSWNLLGHHSAWWCATLFSCFVMSMLGDVRAKRLLVLQTVMILQMENLPGGTELDYPIRVGRDMIMSTTFALFQVLFPVQSIATQCDDLTAGAWRNVFRILRSSTRACWADDPIDRALALADCSTEPLQNYFNIINGKLFFVMYEFWESTLRLELRRERVVVLKDLITRIHALTDTSRLLVTNRVLNIVRGKEKMPSKLNTKPPSPALPLQRRPSRMYGQGASKSAPPSPIFLEDAEEEDGLGEQHSPYGRRRRGRPHDLDAFEGVRDVQGEERQRGGGADDDEPYENDADCGRQADMRARTSRRQLQELTMADQDMMVFDDGVDGDAPYLSKGPRPASNDLEMWNRTKQLLREPLEAFFVALNDVFEGLSEYLNPHDVAERVPFAALRTASADLQTALNKIHFELLVKGNKEVDPTQYTTTIFYHLMLVETAQVLLEYGDLMITFDRSRYKSQWVRMWEFFFYDYWKHFWIELPKRLTLATPRDVRMFKDGIKMACAYGVGVMFTEYTDTENVYYFGMAILMGVGWPTVGDTMVASVYRVTGMALACSIAYVAVWHSNNLTQELAIALAGVFIALIFRDQPPYSHTAQYCSMLVITALNSAGTKMVLLSRIVSNCFTVMTYYAIVVFFFPTDVLKITFATEVCAIDTISRRFSRLVTVMQNPLDFSDKEHLEVVQTEIKHIGDMRNPMWAQLIMLGNWLPKAAGEPTVRGEPYPIGQMRNVFSSLRRLASATDVLHNAVTLLFRTRMEGALPTALSMYTGLLPLLRKVDRHGRQVLNDFVNAMRTPYEWSPQIATRNLSRFLALNEDLHNVFNCSHRRHTEALREHFRNSVVNRTFAHAARNFLIDPSSFAGPPQPLSRGGGGGGGGGGLEGLLINENASFGSRQQLQAVLHEQQGQQGQQDKPVFTAVESVNYLGPDIPGQADPSADHGASFASSSSFEPVGPSRVSSSAASKSGVSGIEALDDPAKEPVSREVAQKLMNSFAFPAGARRMSSDRAGRGRDGSVDHPLNVRGGADQRDADEDTRNLEAVLKPIQEQAEEEEYQAFVANAIGDDFSLRSDVNNVITILVATDMFFGEAERLVKTMYAINRYARSRTSEPHWYKEQMRANNAR